MKHKSEAHIWVIIILVATILIVHTMPLIAKSIENMSINVSPVVSVPPVIDYNQIIPIDISKKKKQERKYYNVFEPWHLSGIFTELNQSEEIDDPKGLSRYCSNDGYRFLVNPQVEEFLEKVILWNNEHRVYIVRAENGHKIDLGQLVMLYNVDDRLKEVKSIWYMYVNLDWKFENGWVFRENNKYYAPENNTIIEFPKDTNYEQYELITETPKYFIIIYNF